MADEMPPITEPVEEPDLHDVGPTPLAELGVPDPEALTEDEWFAAQGESQA